MPPVAPIPRLHTVARTASTNTDLGALATADPPAWPHLSVLAAREQTAGKGRAGRSWHSTGLDALTFSVLLRPAVEPHRWGWLPLLAGLATVRAVRDRTGAGDRVGLKWPNDVVDRAGGTTAQPGWGRMRKLGGILTEVLPDGEGVVAGIGLNLGGANLPVPWAGTVQHLTSVRAPGASSAAPGASSAAAGAGSGEGLLQQIVGHLAALVTDLERGAAVGEQVQQVCVSIGACVQVQGPAGDLVQGTAVALAEDGALVVDTTAGRHIVHAGDVHHLRTTEQPDHT